ncbi:PilN domain-containing protein [Desulfobacula sp.]
MIVTLGGYANAINFLQKNKDTSNFVFLHVADYEITFVLVTNRTPCTVRTFSTALYSPENLTLSVEQSIMAFNQKTGADISFDIYLSSDEDNPEAKHIYNALKTKYQNLKIKKINSNDFLINLSPDKTVKHLFNFCQGQYGTSSFVKTYLPNIAVGIVLFFIVFGLFLVNTIFDYSILNKKIAAVDSRTLSIFMATFPDNKKIYDPYLQMKANVREAIKKSGVVKDKDQPIKNKSVKLLEIMNELSKRIDSSIDIEAAKFLFNNGRLFLSGSTDNFNNVDNIKTKLESSDLFEKVSISSAAADKNGDRVNFKFIIEI